MIQKAIHFTYKAARRVAVGVIGATILILGVVMLVTPGPGLIVIPIGLAILGLEFAWARRWLRKVRDGISRRNQANHADRAEGHRMRAEAAVRDKHY